MLTQFSDKKSATMSAVMVTRLTKTHVVLGAVLAASGLFLANAFIYPGVVAAKLGVPVLWFGGLSLVGIIAARVTRFFRPTTQQQTWFLLAATVVLYLYMALLLGNTLLFTNFSFAYFHIHAVGLRPLGMFLTGIALSLLTREFLHKRRAFWLGLLPIIFTPLLFIYSQHSESGFWHLEKEDSVTEWLTFVAFMAASVVAARTFLQLKKAQIVASIRFTLLTLYALATLGFFVIAGEEISWAQRVIGFDTPESIRDQNTQYEFNIHNNKSVFRYVYYAYAGLAAYCCLAWILEKMVARTAVSDDLKLLVSLLTPPYYLFGYFVPMIVYVYIRKTYGDVLLDRWEEYFELLLASGILLILQGNLQRVQTRVR